MATPSQMFEHLLDPIKGWFQENALDFTSSKSPAVTATLRNGACVSLNAAGLFEPGVTATRMPMFLLRGEDDFDVSNPGVTAAGTFVHTAIAPIGKLTALVATGGYELSTTEFDATKNYAPNQLLTATNSNSSLGLLANDRNGAGGSAGVVRQYTDAACGVVSKGKTVNEYNIPVLHFWPIYLPAAVA